MEISRCRVVEYALTEGDALAINRRRTTSASIADRIKTVMWPLGAQAHIGNHAQAGEVYPLVVVRVWTDEYGPGLPGVNGQVLLDGNDTLWVTSVKETQAMGSGPAVTPGTWRWPARVN